MVGTTRESLSDFSVPAGSLFLLHMNATYEHKLNTLLNMDGISQSDVRWFRLCHPGRFCARLGGLGSGKRIVESDGYLARSHQLQYVCSFQQLMCSQRRCCSLAMSSMWPGQVFILAIPVPDV